jgi:pyruvate dehydrogenase E2 component (dihydrolipoamide acetyltransferase)
MTDIVMPQLGETVTEGTITRWNKKVGDEIAEDEVLFEVSTDKVDSEVPSPTAGYIAEILVQEGETVAIGEKLAVISAEAGGGGGSSAPAAEAPAAESAAATEDLVEQVPAPPEPAVAPRPEPVQAEAPAPQPEPEPQAAPAAQAVPGEKPDRKMNGKLLSPVVRKLVADNGIDPSQIEGTGQGGRITRNDVLAFIDRSKQSGGAAQPATASAPAPARAAPAAAAPAAPAAAPMAPASSPTPAPVPARPAAPAVPRGGQTIPFSNIRRRTAEHMVRSQATSAHTLVVFEVDYSAVDKVRRKQKDAFKAEEGTSLTYLPFIARATIDAIREFPHVNATVGNDELIVHGEVNLGVAVDLNFEGLIVPVVHDAGSKRLRALAREMADLAKRAHSRKLGADDISGGTFTITNAGGFGTMLTAPVINQPQVAILSTDGIKKKPVVVALPDGTDAIAIHPVGNLALSFDHRAYDGAYASAFLARIKEILETRDWSVEL